MTTTSERSKTLTHFAAALLMFAACLLAPKAARAQWAAPTPNSTDITNTNAGNVGVGTQSPGDRLTVAGSGLFGNVNTHVVPYGPFDSQGNSLLEIGYGTAHSAITPFAMLVLSNNTTATDNATGVIGQFSFVNRNIAGTSVDRRLASIMSWVDGANNAGTLQFYTGSGGTLSERMRVTSGGNVGVGTASPANLLHVEGGSSSGQLRVSGTGLAALNLIDNGAPVDQKFYQLRTDGGFFRLNLINDAVTAFVHQNVLTANSAGNVGIGAVPQPFKLNVTTAAANDGILLTGSTTWSFFVANLSDGHYNSITKGGDRGIIYGGNTAGSPGGGFVITPWASATSGLRLDASGNVGIGTATPTHTLEVAGTINASQGITGASINATYQDVAEWVPSEQKLSAGTVVVLDAEKTNHVVASTTPYDTKVAGVVSAKPGISLGEGGEGKALVATTGRVKVKVDATRAPIRVGDLLVTSDVEGVAMKSVPVDLGGTQIHRPGTIIGKALEPLEKGAGEILVLLSLQ